MSSHTIGGPRLGGVADAVARYPRRSALTRRFTLGAPRSARCVGDGSRVVFLRSRGPRDLENALWTSTLDPASGEDGGERLIADPTALVPADQVPAAERARRERSRESASGITAFDVDRAGKRCVFPLSGRLWVADLDGGATREVPSHGPVIDPRISPDGALVAYSTGSSVWTASLGADGWERELARSSSDDVTWGLADFIAGEEMDRYHGVWWSPDSGTLLVQRADAAPEPVWYISDPAHPERPQRARHYPQALTRNARVDLFAIGARDGELVQARWDRDSFEYLAAVHWSRGGDPLLLVQVRDQRRDAVLALDPRTGATRALAQHRDRHWLDLLAGTPAWTPDGRLLTEQNDADTHRLALDGVPFTAPEWDVRAVLDVGERDVLARASRDPRSVDVVAFEYSGRAHVVSEGPGVHSASRAGAGLVLSSAAVQRAGVRVEHRVRGRGGAGPVDRTLRDLAEDAGLEPRVEFVTLGEHALRAAVVRPHRPVARGRRLPVLAMPYGGPGFQRVLFDQRQYWEAQWWADQGFLVLIADGRGTPGRGLAFEHAIRESFAEITLADQVEAVRALPAVAPEADLSRVAIRGWSYGGYLSALAVLRAPDVFRAAVAGAPPVEWTLYDTHYTERYLGLDPQVYRRNGLIDAAPGLRRPLLLVHGFADDNVSVANTLRLSQALLAAGRPHAVLPLTGITHMTNDPATAENLLLVQLAFLRDALGLPSAHAHDSNEEGHD